ncbi:MAG: hypothetical protein MUE52_07140 [Tabrizicola sp.]|nr:hypothetical protein [Tabrizicola sp.]
MSTRYRVAGTASRRTAVAERLDRVVRSTLGEALEQIAQGYSAEDGPYIVVRKLDLSLWLDPTGTPDAAIARLWAGALTQALSRALVDAPRDLVATYENRADYLAEWLYGHALNQVRSDWRFTEFHVLADVPTGRAAQVTLAREPELIGAVLTRLHRDGRVRTVARTLSSQDIAHLWQGWIGAAPAAGRDLTPALEAAVGCVAPLGLARPDDPEDRARHALGWLVALTVPPARLPAEVAAPLAMQITYATALLKRLPALTELLLGQAPISEIHALLARVPADLKLQAEWLTGAATQKATKRLSQLARLVLPEVAKNRATTDVRPSVRRSAFAGTGLLLPMVRDLGLAECLGPNGRAQLLALAVPSALRPLASADPALHWLADWEEGEARSGPVDWPAADSLPSPLRQVSQDAASHGTGPGMPTLRCVLDRFSLGLRGMSGASAEYLAHQFLMQPGEIESRPRDVILRLGPLPLRLLLVMGGRTGAQGPIPWLGNRTLIVEVPHA